jgi:hypothetical protein
MKNIHVLPTDKPSRLIIYNSKLELVNYPVITPSKNQQNINITSDEEISISDYITDGYRVWKWKDDSSLLGRKKIILTTDQDLIKDGVQAIDDEFLEWFVKNPSCEFVNIEKYHGINTSIAEVNYISGDGSLSWQGRSDLRDYKIIIPKEEPKQELPTVNGSYGCTITIKEPKQETLEKDAHKMLVDYGIKSMGQTIGVLKVKEIMVNFAKWQQEQDKNKYSDEEVLELLKTYRNSIVEVNPIDIIYLDKWFEQFKKK